MNSCRARKSCKNKTLDENQAGTTLSRCLLGRFALFFAPMRSPKFESLDLLNASRVPHSFAFLRMNRFSSLQVIDSCLGSSTHNPHIAKRAMCGAPFRDYINSGKTSYWKVLQAAIVPF